MSKVLVIIPTFDHGPTLRPAIHSALNQTEQDLSIVVIGDGAAGATDEIMAELCASEPRLRYEPRTKSPRTGEPYRDDVIRSNDSEFVLYLSDDDVWMPNHAEVLCQALADHDFAATLSASIDSGGLRISRMDYADPADRALASQTSRVSLTETGHRRDSYLRLPRGWQTSPDGEYTDHWMWKQWLAQDLVRACTVPEWTSLHIPQFLRYGVSFDDRAEEQMEWWARFVSEDWARDRDSLLREALMREYASRDRLVASISVAHELSEHENKELRATVHRLNEELQGERATNVERQRLLDDAELSLDEIRKSRTWVLAQAVGRRSGWHSLRRSLVVGHAHRNQAKARVLEVVPKVQRHKTTE